MRCKTKQRKGSRPDLILGYRRTTTNENSPGIRRNPDEMNDHQREQSRDTIRLIAIETMKGAFGDEGALHFFVYRLDSTQRAIWITDAHR